MTGYFPVNYSTLSQDALAIEVLPGFGIGKLSECLFYTGGFNDTYRVKTIDGKTYFLRVYRRSWRSLADIQYELDVLSHLKQKDFPATRLVPYQDGQLYCTVPAPEGTRYLVLFTEALGSEISYDESPQEVAQH
jgi:Ser/Thr protein kinase RdoA (MazF antagonist)